jgi:hypothetical protein
MITDINNETGSTPVIGTHNCVSFVPYLTYSYVFLLGFRRQIENISI